MSTPSAKPPLARPTAILLAAGMSRRMGAANKLLLALGDATVLGRSVRTVLRAPVAGVIVVTGHEDEAVREALDGLPAREEPALRIACNADYAEGMASSIRRGVDAAPLGAGGYLIALGDMPLVSEATLALLCARFAEEDSPGAVVLPIYQGQRGHPVLFGKAHREALLRLRGDGGARPILKQHKASVVEVPVDDAGVLRDVDTPAAYARLAEGGE